jgi:uncharacterized membrane protein YeaQ/YmgE (transglycosylase-associated protein family)
MKRILSIVLGVISTFMSGVLLTSLYFNPPPTFMGYLWYIAIAVLGFVIAADQVNPRNK